MDINRKHMLPVIGQQIISGYKKCLNTKRP